MFSKVFLIALVLAVANAAQFTLRNLEGGEIWAGIQGNDGKAPLSNGGLVLAQGQEVTLDAPDDWAGRFWGRTYCSDSGCLTGDCGNGLECNGNGGAPPVSLAEITLKGWEGLDYYDLSLVDGYNIRISIEPVGGTGDGSEYSCQKAKCEVQLNDECPDALKLTNGDGTVIACKSACLAFDTDEYCCRGDHGVSATCQSTDWDVNYPEYFKSRCPDAYSYAYDDNKSTFTCITSTYIVTFGA